MMRTGRVICKVRAAVLSLSLSPSRVTRLTFLDARGAICLSCFPDDACDCRDGWLALYGGLQLSLVVHSSIRHH